MITIHSLQYAHNTSRSDDNEFLRSKADPAALLKNGDVNVTLYIKWSELERIFQNIVRRSKTLRYISIMSSFMCTDNDPEGFGGQVTFITADVIRSTSTHTILRNWIREEWRDEHKEDDKPHGERSAAINT